MYGEISVLLVDDDRSLADLAATHLERLHDGMAVETETAAETALSRFERDPESVDCIVSDYTMPGMDGLSFLAAIREFDPQIPFVLFTGKGSEEIASEAIAAGVTDYLQKGTGTEQYELLANRVENAVEASRAEERAADLARINSVVAETQRGLVRQSTREGIERRVCECLAESTPYTLSWIGVDDDGFAIRERVGCGTEVLDDVSIPLSGTSLGPVGRAFATGEPQVVRDVTDDAAFEPWGAATDRETFGSVIVLPLSDGTSEEPLPYGVLGIYSSDRRAFTDAERDALTELAGTIAQAIHAAETRARLERREHALAESERKYRSLIDAAPDAIFVADANTGEIVETNAAATELLDRDRKAILGMDQSDLHPDGDAERYRELFEDGIATETPSATRLGDGSSLFVERADGKRVPVEISAGIVEVGDRTLVHGRFRDMTDQRARERELHEERAIIESLFDATPDPIYAFDADGEMRRWNESFQSVVGYAAEEIAEMGPLDFVPPEDYGVFRDGMESIIEEDEAVTIESALLTNAGESIPHEFSGAPFGVDGRGVVGVGRDITARKARERDRERYRTTIEAVDDAVYALDEQGKFEFVNGAFTDLTGYDRAEILGEGVDLIKDDETIRLFEDVLRELLSSGTHETTVEFELRTAAGERIACEDHLAVRMVDGEFLGVAGAIRDATERRDREATVTALHEATRELVRAEDRQGVARATATAAKEVLGFPLTAVRRYDPETDSLEPAAVTELVSERYGERPTYTRGEGLPWRAFESGDPLVASGEAVSYRTVDFESALYVPIGGHGTLSIVSLDREFDDADIELTRVLAANATAALDRLDRERELEAARSRFRALTENTTLGILTIDGVSTIRYANDAIEDVFGHEPDELIGESLTTLMPERFHEDHFDGIARHLRDGSKALDWEWIELPGKHRDGREIQLGISFGKHRDGEEYRFTATVRDITERKRHEQAISALHDATREMMNAKRRREVAETSVGAVADVLELPLNGIWLYNEDDATLRPAAVSDHGREAFDSIPAYGEGDGLTWEVFESGEVHHYDRVDREPGAHNPATPARSEILVPLGEHGVLVVGSMEEEAFDAGDRSLVKLLGANTEAALDRADRERQLVVERDRLGALFENVPDAALSYEFVDEDPVVRSVNSRFEEVFGYAANEVVGERIDEYIVPPDREAEGERFNEALLRGETVQRTVRRETVDGVRDFLLHVVPLERGEQNVEGYSIYTDITDRMRRQRDLERQNELLDDFASVISHDLRNPMSVARGRLELAEADAPTEHHGDVFWALDRMETLIEDVLTLARQGRRIGETERVSLSTVVEQAWQTAGSESATLTVENAKTVEADPDRLVRLFENLFRNAVEHAGENCTVVVGEFEDGFFVVDDGPGIPENEREDVFEGGYTTTDSGTGLGLMIVRSIAEAHGWTVRVAESDRGTRFEVHT